MSIYDIRIGNVVANLDQYQDQFVLIVNIADKCGFASQLEDLEKLYQSKELNCHVIAFPSNQFNQQSRDSELMRDWCSGDRKLSFQVEDLVEVNGSNTCEIFRYLKKHAKGALGQERITWNYTKFLICPNEVKIKRFSPKTNINKIMDFIREYKED